jgi:nucleoside-diphosphate-sugar epimerase/predicted dehydrogenase
MLLKNLRFWRDPARSRAGQQWMSNLRLAILGSGNVVQFGYLPALRQLGWPPLILFDFSSDPYVSKLGRRIPRVIKSLDWQRVANDFDAAIVVLPPPLHVQTATALLAAGKHVLLEKPLPSTRLEFLSMNEAAADSAVTLHVNFQRRHLRVAHWTEALIRSDTLGKIKRVDVREGSVSKLDTISGALQPELTSDAGLRDVLADNLDLVLRLFGNVEVINYWDDNEGGIEAERVLEGRLQSGACVKIELSRMRRLSNSIRIEGDCGFVEIHLFKNEVLSGSPNALAFKDKNFRGHAMKPQFFGELFESALNDFRESALNNDQAQASDGEYIKVVELMERCNRSRKALIYPWTDPALARSCNANAGQPTLINKSKVLVTGATGFIGCRLVERLIQEHSVQVRCTIHDPQTTARLARFPVEMVYVDLTKPDEIERAVEDISFIFHCAYLQSRRQNIDALRNLVEACTAHPVRRLIQVSTFAVYEPFPDGALTEETPDGDRSNEYVDTKLELEQIIFDAVQQCGIAATIIQPSIVYGPFCRPWTNGPAEKLAFGQVVLPDLGEGLCNAVYIDDLVDALILAATSPKSIGERFIVSGPESITWATFFKEIAGALGTNPPVFWPYERIAKSNSEIARGVRVLNPRRVKDLVMKSKLARQVFRGALELMPVRLRRMMVDRSYLNARPMNERYVPNQRELKFYSAKAATNSDKARSILEYNPRFDFQRGMSLTGPYLQWMYGKAREIGRRVR